MNIQSCKDLLLAIFNSNEGEETKHGVICVYDTFEKYKLIAVFSKVKYCANFFGTTENCIRRNNIFNGQLRNDRYKIERVKL